MLAARQRIPMALPPYAHGQLVVGFDLDDVVAHLRTPMAQVVSDFSGIQIDWRDWDSWSHFEKFGMSLSQFLTSLVDQEVLQRCQPDEGAVEAIAMLRSEGLGIAVVTARSYHPKAQEITTAWLAMHGIEVDHLEIVLPSQTKNEALMGIPNLVAYIDDHPGHLSSISEVKPELPVFLMDRPWNRADDRFERLHHITDYADRALELAESAQRMRASGDSRHSLKL